MSDEEYEYEYDEDGMDYDSPAGSDADEGDDISIQIANAFYEADGGRASRDENAKKSVAPGPVLLRFVF
jgi:hypothetical protein